MARKCSFIRLDGSQCRAGPMRDQQYCFWHLPGNEEEAAETERLGGLRRRREKVMAETFDFQGLASVTDIRRLLEVAAVDALGLENSISRARTLAYLAQVAGRLLEVGELQDRVAELEETLRRRPVAWGGQRR